MKNLISDFKLFEDLEYMENQYSGIAIKGLQIIIQNQIYHWQAEKMGDHKTFDEFSDTFQELNDKIVEVIQGKYGRVLLEEDVYIPLRNTDSLEPYMFYDQAIGYYNTSREVIFANDDEVLAVLDEIVATLQQLKYLLTFE